MTFDFSRPSIGSTGSFKKNNSEIVVEKQISPAEDEVPDSLKIFFPRSYRRRWIIYPNTVSQVMFPSLEKKHGKVELAIKDNDTGFSLEGIFISKGLLTGLGIMSMRGQVEHLGGSFAIESGKGRKTVIRAS